MAVDQASIAAQATAGIVAVNAAISTVGTLQGAGITLLSTVTAAVESALPAFQFGIDALDADIDEANAGGVAAGLAPPEMAAALMVQASEMQQLATLVTAKAFLARAGINIEQAPG
jgi:hypothetical protein